MLDIFSHVFGLDNLSGPFYGFWSGIGSDIGELALIGTVITLYRNSKCYSCWRIAHHSVRGTHYKTCHRHATTDIHRKIHSYHKHRYPEQHALFNGGGK